MNKINPCPKHDLQHDLQVQEERRLSGDKFFRVKCPGCGKLGPRRKSFHGACKAWNEQTNNQRSVL